MERSGDETFVEKRIEKRRGKDGCGCAMAITEIKKSDIRDVSGAHELCKGHIAPGRLQNYHSLSLWMVNAWP